jgi:two-component system, OmpR family, sensor histidine kinase TctE
LLTLARAEHGAAEGEMKVLSLVDSARQVGLELALAAVKKEIDLALEASGDVHINGNALLLHELIVNLADNAIRYTPPGGKLTLRVYLDEAADGQPVLEVEDSGIGIAVADRERVFAPFYRASSAQQVNADGAGLGLTIVRDIAALHGARIVLADGANGCGLKVTIRFPVV